MLSSLRSARQFVLKHVSAVCVDAPEEDHWSSQRPNVGESTDDTIEAACDNPQVPWTPTVDDCAPP